MVTEKQRTGGWSMDFRKLIYFHYVATYQNFTKAAEECHIAQTAMSRTIASLEEELSFTLFDRSHKRVTLTPAGRAFWEKAKLILDVYQNAVTESKEMMSRPMSSPSRQFR